MSKVIVSGSIAYDNLHSFDGFFQASSFESAKKEALSVAFVTASKSVHFGGCAGNIVYNGKLIGEDFVLIGIAGHNFGDYRKWFEANKIDTSSVIIEKSAFTSEATVTSDKKGQQITFFHEGASAFSAKYKKQIINNISSNAKVAKLAIISPNNKAFIFASIEACEKNAIPFIFDPGQVIGLFNANELRDILKKAAGLIVNESESAQIARQLGVKESELPSLAKILAVTLGAKGSVIYWNGEKIHIPAVKPKIVRDPTGCGDAWRAGFLAIVKDYMPNITPKILRDAGMNGSELASKCVAKVGTQNHR